MNSNENENHNGGHTYCAICKKLIRVRKYKIRRLKLWKLVLNIRKHHTGRLLQMNDTICVKCNCSVHFQHAINQLIPYTPRKIQSRRNRTVTATTVKVTEKQQSENISSSMMTITPNHKTNDTETGIFIAQEPDFLSDMDFGQEIEVTRIDSFHREMPEFAETSV